MGNFHFHSVCEQVYYLFCMEQIVFYFYLFFIYLGRLLGLPCGILVPRSGVEHGPRQWKQSPNHWTTREFPIVFCFLINLLIFIGGWFIYNTVLVFAIHRHESPPGAHESRQPDRPPTSLPPLSPSGSSQSTIHPSSCAVLPTSHSH